MRRVVYTLRFKNRMIFSDIRCTFPHIRCRNMQHGVFFADLSEVSAECVTPYARTWGCYLFLYSVKEPPVISRKILQKWLL